MKKVKNRSMILLFVSLSFLSFNIISCSTQGDDTDNQSVELTQEEKDMLIHMREEEKLARDVYDYLFNVHGLQIFDNISNSEQVHMDKVLLVLNKYNIPDPALPNAGEFSDTFLQNLYNQLTAQGDPSVIDALKVGATIEDLDIYDLQEFSPQTDNEDILNLFEDTLECGSRNHMRAFYSQITNRGDDYTPQYISQTEFDDIINSPRERCN